MSKVILAGCGARKGAEKTAARDLYTGPLFRSRLPWLDRVPDPWWIVSARYGLVPPDAQIAPYDLRVTDLDPLARSAWALSIVSALIDELSDDAVPSRVCVELHCGADYADMIEPVVLAAGLTSSRPLRGLGIGEQRAWYARAAASPLLRGAA